MKTSILKPVLATGLAVTAVAGIYVEHDRAGRLREENDALRAQVQQAMTASAPVAPKLATTQSSPNDPRQTELLKLRGEVTRQRAVETERQKELLRLRSEVTGLRTAQTELAQASRVAIESRDAEIAKIRTELAGGPEVTLFNSIGNNLRIIEGAKEQWALENKKVTTDPVTLSDLTAYFRNNVLPPGVVGEVYVVSTVGVLAHATLPPGGKLIGKTGPFTTTSY